MQSLLFILLFCTCMVSWCSYNKTYEKFLESDKTVNRIRNKLISVFPELQYVKLMKGTSSYTINKSKIYLCTEDNKGEVYDDNMLIYVVLHELAHSVCPDIGHGIVFQKIFKSFLRRGELHNLYDPNLPRVENYCNINGKS